MRLAWLFAACFLLAGCTAPAATTTAPPAPAPLALPKIPAAFEYACPPGGSHERSALVCAASLVDRTTSLNEPYLAIDPANSRVMALGAHAAPTIGALSIEDAPGANVVRLNVYFTRDDGASWTGSQAPRVTLPSAFGPVDARLYYDPALVFGPDGTLHLVGMASNDAGAAGGGMWKAKNVPFYTSTKDGGKTWSKPVVLDERFSDRTFIAVGVNGHLYANWGWYSPEGIDNVVAWSYDNGATWTRIDSTGCRGFSPFLARTDGVFIACVSGSPRNPDNATLMRLDETNHTLTQVGAIAGFNGYRARLGTLPGGGFAAAIDASDGFLASTSLDAGQTWSAPVNLLDALKLDDGGDGAFLKWFGTDPRGAAHLEFGISKSAGCQGGDRGAPGTCRVVHAAFDPSSWKLIQETILSEADGAKAYRAPGSLGPPEETQVGDDFYAFAFAPDHGVLLWTRDGATDFTFVKPLNAP